MRLLLFSDVHRDLEAVENLVQMSQDVDVVVGAGDFGSMRKGTDEVMEALSAIQRPAVVVAGNGESPEELAAACQVWPTAQVLHGAGTQIEGTRFWGVGGAIPVTPFGAWSYDLTEDEGRQLLAACPPGAVLVSHSPPHGAVDQSSAGQHLGSVAVREAVQRVQPALVVCGHIHDCSGQSTTLDQTPVVNAGPQGIVWELPGP
ncbi:MAG: serine/threonine protein phosphatase [Planctomycetales bacterium]|nr:serine/threonine protein phosphatase [Planctomycetales bacterium]